MLGLHSATRIQHCRAAAVHQYSSSCSTHRKQVDGRLEESLEGVPKDEGEREHVAAHTMMRKTETVQLRAQDPASRKKAGEPTKHVATYVGVNIKLAAQPCSL